MDQGSTMKRSAVHNFAPTVTKFCVMWEGQALPHDTKFGNSRCEIVGRRVFFIWSLIHGLRWSGLIKAEPVSLDLWCHPSQANVLCYFMQHQPVWCWKHIILTELDQYHGCWCPGSSHLQVISKHGIDCKGQTGHCFPWGIFSTTCIVSVLRNDWFWFKKIIIKSAWTKFYCSLISSIHNSCIIDKTATYFHKKNI